MVAQAQAPGAAGAVTQDARHQPKPIGYRNLLLAGALTIGVVVLALAASKVARRFDSGIKAASVRAAVGGGLVPTRSGPSASLLKIYTKVEVEKLANQEAFSPKVLIGTLRYRIPFASGGGISPARTLT